MNADMRRVAVALGVAIVMVYLAVAAINVLYYFGVPPQPLALGTVQWFDEVGVTVDRIERVSHIGAGTNVRNARGEFYIVHARILAPFGFRPDWHDGDVEVRTFAGSGGTMHDLRFTVDKAAQAVLDRKTGRPGPDHIVLGAQQREDLIFDLPRNVEQPAILFLPANAPAGLLLSLAVPHFWQPHRFNLRYD